MDQDPNDWAEFDDPRLRYRLCRVGFAICAMALILQAADLSCLLAAIFGDIHRLAVLIREPLWRWIVGTPITWGAVIGSYLLWGRWTDPRWQRRAGLLVLMNLVDGALWIVQHGDALGLRQGDLRHVWLIDQIGSGQQWFEMMLLASLAADLAIQLGKPEAADTARVARSLAMAGAALWLILLVITTDWARGWPFLFRPLTLETYLLRCAANFVLILTDFQVIILCILAARQCGQHLRSLTKADLGHDLLQSRSETEDDLWR
jgi:hypothetical protein